MEFEPVTVTVNSTDPNDVASLVLWYAVDGGDFENLSMAHQGGGDYAATIPGQTRGATVQFYVAGVDALGAESMFPAAGGRFASTLSRAGRPAHRPAGPLFPNCHAASRGGGTATSQRM